MDEFEPDVGVLVVHGIGTQSEGAELRQWVAAVVDYLEALPPAAGSTSTEKILQPAADDKLVRLHTPPLGGTATSARQRWLVGEAFWADAFDLPDRKEVSRWIMGVSSWFLYLFVVRLWRRFQVDARHVLAGLAFASSILVLLRSVARDGAPAWLWLVVALTLAGVVLAGARRGKRLGGFVVAATVLIGYPLAAFAATATVSLWLIGLLPGKIGEKARATQLRLSRSVGDVYSLIASPRRQQAMFDAIAAAASRLATAPHLEGRPIVLVAHSQGAALTYRALNRSSGLGEALAGRAVTIVTYGAGIVPIQVLEHRLRGRRPGWQWLQGLAGLVGLLLFTFSIVRAAMDSVDTPTRVVTNASVALVALCLVATWRQERRARCEPDSVRITGPADQAAASGTETPQAEGMCIQLRSPAASHLRWVDLWAPWDPVPNGPLSVAVPCTPSPCRPHALEPPGPVDEFLSCRVSNLHQPWRDHVVYRDNHEDVVSRWVGEIATRANPSVTPRVVERPGHPEGSAVAGREWRRRRGRSLLLGQAAALIAGILLLAKHWDRLDDLGRRAARRLPLRSALGSIAGGIPEGLRDVVLGKGRNPSHLQGLLVALAAVLVLVAVVTVTAYAWQAAATRAFLAGSHDDQLQAPAGLAATAVAVVGVVGLLVWAAVHEIGEVPIRQVRVHPVALIGSSSGSDRPSLRGSVRFEPLETGDDTPVVVEVDDEPRTADLDAGVEYGMTATAVGGKDCTVTAAPGPTLTDVRVTCSPSEAVLARARR